MNQNSYTIGHRLTNLIIPGEPDVLDIATRAGIWTLTKDPDYMKFKAVIEKGQCAETYSIRISNTYTGSRSAAIDAASDELIPLCLGASYLTAMSVAPSRSLPFSDVSFLQIGPHFPRPRAMGPLTARRPIARECRPLILSGSLASFCETRPGSADACT